MNQTYFNLSEVCHYYGVRHAVFSPGSRNAVISISFARNEKIKKWIVVDERSAAFIGLGIAQQTLQPVVLCCTSGSALLNYGPAIAEAFYQKIPLIILSADRPTEWIDQQDGQTIKQQNIFATFTKGSYQLPTDLTHPDAQWEFNRKLGEAIALAMSGEPGPVHLNIPIREPFYPSVSDKWDFSKPKHLFNTTFAAPFLSAYDQELVRSVWAEKKKKLIVVGQHVPFAAHTLSLLQQISQNQYVPVVADIHSNAHELPGYIRHHDLFLSQKDIWEKLNPELVLYLGDSLISKNLKLFLRQSGAEMIHVRKSFGAADPTQLLSRVIIASDKDVLETLQGVAGSDDHFLDVWEKANDITAAGLFQLELPYSEALAFQYVLNSLPDEIDLHLSNSMPIRYTNFFGIKQKSVRIFANRGTSGIDGCNSTAVGNALVTERKVVLITGDLAFLYDRNAFWHEYDISNLYVIVMNNFGGGIFDLILGPASLPENERKTHFTTPHNKDLKLSATEAEFSYFKANDEVTLQLALSSFFESGGKPRLLEIQTDASVNQSAFQQLKNVII